MSYTKQVWNTGEKITNGMGVVHFKTQEERLNYFKDNKEKANG